MSEVARTIALFAVAGLLEVGGGYLVWRSLRADAGVLAFIVGSVAVVGFAVVLTRLDGVTFGRVFAAYGGVFVVMSLLWGWGVDGRRPDTFDWIGAAVILVGVGVLFFAPRSGV